LNFFSASFCITFLSDGIATSINKQVLSFLFLTTMSGLLIILEFHLLSRRYRFQRREVSIKSFDRYAPACVYKLPSRSEVIRPVEMLTVVCVVASFCLVGGYQTWRLRRYVPRSDINQLNQRRLTRKETVFQKLLCQHLTFKYIYMRVQGIA
jgi:hypothetical protein